MSWLHYLIEANIYLGVFYLCYCLLLNRETHYVLGRAFLLFSCVISFVLPFTQISILKPAAPVVEGIIILEPISGLKKANIAHAPLFNLQDALLYAYIAGVSIAMVVLTYRFYRLYKLSNGREAEIKDNYKIIRLDEENTAFSFFNYMFVGSHLPRPQTVIAHELVHIRQKHSVDILFLEIIKVINWFNPLVYLLQHSLKTIHEYIADEQTAAHEKDALAYSSFLVSNAYGIQGSSVTHSFFNYNLLKKRIIMLNQQRSGRLARLKYLAVIPLCGGMLCASTLVFSKDYGFIDLSPKAKAVVLKPITVTEAKTDTVPAGKKADYSKKVRSSMPIPPPPPPLPPVKKHKKAKSAVAEIRIEEPLPPVPSADVKEIRIDPPIVKPYKAKKGKMKKSADVLEIRLDPPAAPDAPADIKTPPPPPPPAPKSDKDGIQIEATDISYRGLQLKPSAGGPVVIANNKVITLPSVKNNEILSISGDKLVYYSKNNPKGIAKAKSKYGDQAKNGVLEIIGKYTIKVQIDANLVDNVKPTPFNIN
ncbi:M56 family metallopeptidase [Inquilinus sp. KBS0705]|nr:M56 family metallopeptidase [Inquilinus sp. KBS0705]